MSEYRTAASASVETSLDRKRARFRQCAATPAIVAWSASSCSERRDPATEACYRPPADGPLGRRSGRWYGRWLSSGQRLSAVCVACRSLDLALPEESVERAICRSRRCFHRAGSVSSWVPPVGRGSWGLMPLAARHTAISRMRGVLRWVSGTAQTGGPSPWQAWCWTWSARSATCWDRLAR